jgi:hypothetical protein
MEQQPGEARSKALAFANGLRNNALAAGRRWSAWPGGSDDLATVVACIDQIRQRLAVAPAAGGAELIAACIADLRVVLEWTTYQSASLSTARALLFARKVRAFTKRLGLVDERTSGLAVLADSDESLIENVRTKNGYMIALAARCPHLELPQPLVNADRLAPPAATAPNKFALIRQLRAAVKAKPPAR